MCHRHDIARRRRFLNSIAESGGSCASGVTPGPQQRCTPPRMPATRPASGGQRYELVKRANAEQGPSRRHDAIDSRQCRSVPERLSATTASSAISARADGLGSRGGSARASAKSRRRPRGLDRGGKNGRPVSSPRQARRRRNGRGLPGPRHQARPGRRVQSPGQRSTIRAAPAGGRARGTLTTHCAGVPRTK